MSTDWTPPGHCPHCGYAMAAGVCPECGQEVAAGQLLRTPAWVEQRKQIKRLVVGGLAFLLVAIAVGVYDQANWPACLPSNALLFLDDSPDSRTGKELWARFLAGKLSQVQADEMLENWVKSSGELKIRTPHPKDIDVFAEACVDPRLPANTGLRILQREFRVDGQPIGPRKSPCDGWGGWSCRCFLGYDLPPLPVGERKVTFTVVVGLDTTFLGTAPPPGIAMPTVTKHWEARVRINDQYLDHYAKAVWNSELAAAIGAVLSAQLTKDKYPREPESELLIKSTKSPVPIAGRLWVREEAQEDYSPTDCVFVAAAGCDRSHSYSGMAFLKNTARMDLRLVPDAKSAFDAGFTEYLGATTQWHGIELTPHDPGRKEKATVDPHRPDRFFVQEAKESVAR